ncbi:MAG: DUF4435 domain-containing protein [Bacteroidales bacterium]|nr:DUF4435 domain-containing protein [Bacteroidales bacterium]MCF8404361.1 DUF4435 domain-containing protein [Bacteroidales bacterium]
MAKNVILTAEEIISYLQKSDLINLLVEGPYDLLIYNWIEEKINKPNVRILPCGGRSTLLKVFENREQYKDKIVVFIADKDLWVFTGIPEEYKSVVFTSGYSIENDLFCCARNTINNLFTVTELEDFNKILSNLLPWYCSEILKYKSNKTYNLSLHLNQIIPEKSNEICEHFLANIEFLEPTQEIIDEVQSDNYLKLRGKFIFDAAVRQLSAKRKRSKYSRDNVFELCLKMNDNHHFERIINEIEAIMSSR